MKLAHFSERKVIKVSSSRQYNCGPDEHRRRFENKKRKPRFWPAIGKPKGFWVSVEGNGDGWLDWCKSENFRPNNLQYEHEVTLAPDANILYLRNPEDIDDFTDKYRDENSSINRAIAHIGPEFGMKSNTQEIDWRAVAKKYQGIIITPYIWERRLAAHCGWYYGWDCASGCIWDKEAIQAIKVVKEHPVDPNYKEKTHDEIMEGLREAFNNLKGDITP